MKNFSKLLLIAILSIQVSGCSTHKAYLKYESLSDNIQIKDESLSGKALGHVRGNEGGAIWDNCTKKAEDSVREMVAQAKKLGANAIGDIKWYASGNSNPTCKKGWGYLLIWPFILTPLFMSTAVDGTAYQIGHGKKSSSIFSLPQNKQEEDELIQKIMTLRTAALTN